MATARSQVVDLLTPLLPENWKIIDTRRSVDRLSAVTVLIGQDQIAKTLAAPLSHRDYGFTVTVVHPGTDPANEDELDEEIDALLNAIDNSGTTLAWTFAKRVRWGEAYPNAYEIQVTAMFKK